MGAISNSLRLGDVFARLDSLPWDHFVYVSQGALTLDSPCLVIDSQHVPEDGLPKEAAMLGVSECLGVDDVASIRDNAQLQGRQPSEEEMLRAFVHYLKHDAFSEFK